MRFFQLASQTRLVVGDATESEEAVLEMTRQKARVLQVLDRLSLGVQQPLYSLDDFIAMGQEQLEKFDMRVKRHQATILSVLLSHDITNTEFTFEGGSNQQIVVTLEP
jgi:hypothetical protein